MMSVSGYIGNEQLGECLSGSDVVVIPAGVPRKPGNWYYKPFKSILEKIWSFMISSTD